MWSQWPFIAENCFGVIKLPLNGCNESKFCIYQIIPQKNSKFSYLQNTERKWDYVSVIVSGLLEQQKCANSLQCCVTLLCTCSPPSASSNHPFNVITAAIGKRHWKLASGENCCWDGSTFSSQEFKDTERILLSALCSPLKNDLIAPLMVFASRL